MVSVITTVMPAEVPAEVHADVPAGMPAETAAVKSPVIAIDGPSASGKGTVAARVADALGFHLLESGALYRLVALEALRAGVGPADEAAISRIAAGLPVRFIAQRTLLRDEDVTEALRGEDVGNRASEVACLPAVRAALLDLQRAFRSPPGLVAEGRDMGTIVFPDALLKVFLTARLEVRAERRYKQLKDKGNNANLAALSRDLGLRDARDSSRATAPLLPAPEATVLDASDLLIDDVVGRIVQWTRERTASMR